MYIRNVLLATAVASFTIAVAHAASQATQNPAPPQGAPQAPAEPAGRGGRGPGRGAAVFPAQQRPPADPALVERGKAVFAVTCSACHGADARGGQLGGPNLLRSPVVLNDRDGELILPIVHGARASKGMPALNVPDEDVKAVAAYLHSLQAAAGRQGAPPPSAEPPPSIVVGDGSAGQTYFASKCSACHSPTRDLQGIATRVADPKTLQDLWVSGGAGIGRRGGAPPSSGNAAMVSITTPSGEKLEGRLLRIDDFIVSFLQADGRVRSVGRDGDRPRVDVKDPLQAHRDLLGILTDKNIHDVTAYLVTLK
jgi:cytochrome c oxidase cbb3-type subunit 3